MKNVRRVDAPVSHQWTEADSGPKHDPACSCAKPSTDGAKSVIDAALERAEEERKRRNQAGPPVGSVTRQGIVR